MNALTLDPKTGFLQSRCHVGETFDGIKKQAFLELALNSVNSESTVNIASMCDQIGIGVRTFNTHLVVDPAFKEAWQEVLDRIEERLVTVMVGNGRNEKGY